ncbi:MAG: tannase/feruloyl esterase family alpha/beta hydrolase [Gammaproteobacteria bacterium]|nr:MAG: tannase/feruloyl esterase family alpha/beta hydrolase [Gammaproteobacteria bacterium]
MRRAKPTVRKFPGVSRYILLGILPALNPDAALAQPFTDAPASLSGYTAGEIEPAMSCANLANLELREVIVLKAESIPAVEGVPAHCRVNGTIDPEIHFQVNLPDRWNSRFYMVGNGGHAGQQPDDPFQAPLRNQVLTQHFVMASTDTGHDSAKEPGASFVLSNPQKAIDYAFRAVHMTAVTAKQIANAFYDRPVSYSYWNSCSNGGRQGLLEAQRYPEDFDGIIAVAPWVDQTGFTIGALWNQRALDEAPVTAGKLTLIADRIMRHCDAVDGLVDGLIDDPRNCPLNVAEVVPICQTGTDDDSCLTPAQAEAVQKVYDGPRDSRGRRIFHGFMPGSEAVVTGRDGSVNSGWMNLIVSNGPDARPADFGLAQDTMRYLVFQPPRPDWNYRDFDFDHDPELLERWSRLADATDINLRAFRARGGKLIITYGWADTILQPMMGVDYFEQAVTANGPDGADFLRLFMAPGMSHCAGGNGPDQHDAVTAIIDWVEKNHAPEALLARKIVNGKVTRSRPLCPYPQVARYRGQGSIDEAANFQCLEVNANQ